MSSNNNSWLYKKLNEKDKLINSLNETIETKNNILHNLNSEIKELNNKLETDKDLTILLILLSERLKNNKKLIKKQNNRNKKNLNHIQYLNDIINKNFIVDEYIHKCAICLDNINNINNKKTLECEHLYHKECINKVKNKKCPLCNQVSNRF